MNKENKSNDENKMISKIVTQDDATVMSKITVEEIKSNEKKNTTDGQEEAKPIISRSENENARDDKTLMSDITMQNQADKIKSKKQDEEDPYEIEDNKKTKITRRKYQGKQQIT